MTDIDGIYPNGWYPWQGWIAGPNNKPVLIFGAFDPEGRMRGYDEAVSALGISPELCVLEHNPH